MPLRKIVAALSLIPLIAATSAFAQVATPTPEESTAIARFDEYLTRFRSENQAPALSVAIVRGGEILWEKAYGWSDDEGDNSLVRAEIATSPVATAFLAGFVE